jgi:hypothetical protein
MGIRKFDWRDIPILMRYRRQGIYFDNASVLTRGEMLVHMGALLSYFAPATGIFTYLDSDDERQRETLLGQVTHNQDQQLARLSFIAPESALDENTLVDLLGYIIQQIGKRGAFHLLAEVDDGTTCFDNLRQAGFALYVHQRIWKSTTEIGDKTNPSHWRDITGRDVIAVRSLYNTLVPPLVQQVESLPSEQMTGQIYYQEDEIKAYTEVRYGQQGIWMQPFVHPDIKDATPLLADLLTNLPNRHSRPIYMCIRSYQSWLENTLEDLGASAGPTQAVMLKHLAVAQKVKSSFSLPALEGGQQEITTPFVRSERINNL